jgi:hypothetical protein
MESLLSNLFSVALRIISGGKSKEGTVSVCAAVRKSGPVGGVQPRPQKLRFLANFFGGSPLSIKDLGFEDIDQGAGSSVLHLQLHTAMEETN